MNRICPLRNAIQEYAWGSHTAIPELLGEPGPSQKPQAELWMGAHPKAPSQVLVDGEWRSLADVIAQSPEQMLGRRVASAFDGGLPFLYKVLAAAQPLSIQAHPTLDQAKEGFARENEQSIPLDAPHRNYRDSNHKPEIICALTPFWALNGFRRLDRMVAMLREIDAAEISDEVNALEAKPDSEGLRRFFSAIMTMDRDRQKRTVEQVVAFAAGRAEEEHVWSWVLKLNHQYPGDVGVLSPVLLNVVRLQPGEAMLLHAGQLHAYVDGLGIELMANSDNVLRGGLTPKHVDVPELLKVLRFDETEIVLLTPDALGDYPSDVDEFRLSVISAAAGTPYECRRDARGDAGIEILICTAGAATVGAMGDKEKLAVSKGVSVVVPAAVGYYRLEGDATFFKASVP
jgi:mannose-6-phosphate isomerase